MVGDDRRPFSLIGVTRGPVRIWRVRVIYRRMPCARTTAARIWCPTRRYASPPKSLTPYITVTTIMTLQVEFDAAKRQKALTERGLDFARAGELFGGRHFTAEDTRDDYGEARFITIGALQGRLVVVVWTPRGDARRIISMRKANEREQARYARHFE